LIRDYYEYNDRIVGNVRNVNQSIEPLSPASHWVGDLAVEADLQVESERGMIELDLVEGGVHFGCQIDIATGRAQLGVRGDEGKIVFDTDNNSPPAAKTQLNKKGNYKLRYCQLDDMVYLWINGGYIDFGGSSYRNQTNSRPRPRYSPDDPGDAEPVGIGVRGATVRLNRLRVLRDIYYVGPDNPFQENADVRNETGLPEIQLLRVYENPLAWQGNEASQIFDRPRKHEAVYRLGPGEYFPMGDNSPASQDARIWDGDKHVDEEFLIGRAMFIYWPHSLNSPIKYFPNFKRMGFIR
jgi:signal peptidase I